jgi:dipeptidyl aminopeptidase/acylaminoacyl peptidase
VQGETDRVVPVEQAMVLDKALTACGVYHETYYIPWADHGFDTNWSSIATQIAHAKIRDFLARYASR